jgi:PAS domain S-box-containing protein
MAMVAVPRGASGLSGAEIEPVAGEILHRLVDAVRASAGVAYGFGPDGHLRLQESTGVPASSHSSVRLLSRHPLLRRALADGQPLLVPSDRTTEEEATTLLVPFAAVSAMVIPLIWSEQPVGVIVVGADDPDPAKLRARLEAGAGDLGASLGLPTTPREVPRRPVLATAAAAPFDERRYRMLVDTARDVLFTLSPEGMFTSLNPAFDEVTGWSREEWLGRPFVPLIHPEDMPTALAVFGRRFQEEPMAPFELRVRMADGGYLVGEIISATTYRDGELECILGVVRDVTERRQTERELASALEREREASDLLRSLDELKTTFLHAVSHELRTPLSAILGLSLTLAREDLELEQAEHRDLLRRLANNARKLDRLLVDLLDVDRLDRGIVEPNRRLTDVGALVRRVVGGSDVTEHRPVHVAALIALAEVDGPKVERIVDNLLSNAVRHTAPGTTVWVRVGPDHDGVLIVVEDAGAGVSDDLKLQVFEQFHRGSNKGDTTPGVGIGLALVQRFAELHGGRAWVQDRMGGGASFRVWLPAHAPTPDA